MQLATFLTLTTVVPPGPWNALRNRGELLVVVRQRVTARLRKLGHTLAKGMWEGYVQEAPEFVGLFPSRLVEQVWMPYGVVHELMMSAPELPQPIIQQGGASKNCVSSWFHCADTPAIITRHELSLVSQG